MCELIYFLKVNKNANAQNLQYMPALQFAICTGCSRRSCVRGVLDRSVLMSWSCMRVSTSTTSTALSVQSANVVLPLDNTSACIAMLSTARSLLSTSIDRVHVLNVY